jgi:hypothetical protein
MEGCYRDGVFLCALGCVVIDIKAIREVVEGVPLAMLAGGRAPAGSECIGMELEACVR